MESREARTGTAVRLLDGGRRGGKGCVGAVERTYGHPDHMALEVRFEDGGTELCWHHELAKVEGNAPRSLRWRWLTAATARRGATTDSACHSATAWSAKAIC